MTETTTTLRTATCKALLLFARILQVAGVLLAVVFVAGALAGGMNAIAFAVVAIFAGLLLLAVLVVEVVAVPILRRWGG